VRTTRPLSPSTTATPRHHQSPPFSFHSHIFFSHFHLRLLFFQALPRYSALLWPRTSECQQSLHSHAHSSTTSRRSAGQTTTRCTALKGTAQRVRLRAGAPLRVIIPYLEGRLGAQGPRAPLLTAFARGLPGGRRRGRNHRAVGRSRYLSAGERASDY